MAVLPTASSMACASSLTVPTGLKTIVELRPLLPAMKVSHTFPLMSLQCQLGFNLAMKLELAEGVQPINTTNSTKWALKTFEQWSSERNSQPGIDSAPSNLLTSQDPAELCKYLSLFVVEARKKMVRSTHLLPYIKFYVEFLDTPTTVYQSYYSHNLPISVSNCQ